jgi:hypothetical protein
VALLLQYMAAVKSPLFWPPQLPIINNTFTIFITAAAQLYWRALIHQHKKANYER